MKWRFFLLRSILLVAFLSPIPQRTDYSPSQWQSNWHRRARRMPPRFPQSGAKPAGFTFCRVLYTSVRHEDLGHGWNTDYPNSDINFMIRLEEFTNTRVDRTARGQPDHVVVSLADDALFDYPFIFMSDVGTIGLSELEVLRLRAYLLRGGFLWVDDFWGVDAWNHWAGEIARVLPPREYPIVDIPQTHQILHLFYDVGKIPQIPSIQFWRWYGGTSERGDESEQPHFRGVFDRTDRLMVAMTHNTDIADGWEREGEELEFFDRFSADAYALGINIALYAMTH